MSACARVCRIVVVLALVAPGAAAASTIRALPLPPILGGGGTPPPAMTPPARTASAPVPTGAGDAATSFRANPEHDSATPYDELAPPLVRLWTHTFDDLATYPLIVGDKVFVGVGGLGGGSGSSYGGRLYALSAATGRQLWVQSVPGTYFNAIPAYADGRVFVVNFDGIVRAFDAADGHFLWQAASGEGDYYDEPPVATGGSVYVAGGRDNRITSFAASDGAVRWSMSQSNSGNIFMRIAVDDTRVYVDSCDVLAAYDRAAGAILWRLTRACPSVPGLLGVAGGRLFAGTDSAVLDPLTGGRLGGPGVDFFGSFVAAGQTLVTDVGGNLGAVDITSGAKRWAHRLAPAQYFNNAAPGPLGVGADVFAFEGVSSSVNGARVTSFDLATGKHLGTVALPLAEVSSHGQPPVGMAAARGLLVVPGGTKLTAYGSLFVPSADTVALRISPGISSFGKGGAQIDGRLGAKLRASGPRALRIQSDPAPFGRFRTVARVRTRADGGFRAPVRLRRNTRFRTLGPGGRSHFVSTFVYPAARYSFHARGRGSVSAHLALRFDAGIHLAGHAVFLYLDRVHHHRLTRLGGGARLHGSGGRAQATVVFPALRRVGADDLVIYCVPGMSRLGVGFRDIVERQCGRATIAYR